MRTVDLCAPAAFVLLAGAAVSQAAEAETLVRVVPTYECAGVYVAHDEPRDRCNLWFRRQGDAEWQRAYPPVYAPRYARKPELEWHWAGNAELLERREFRGSIVRLTEGVAYEVKAVITEGETGRPLKEGVAVFQTLSSRVPIARTARLGELLKDGPPIITLRGEPDGWVEIVGDDPLTAPEEPLPETQHAALLLQGARFLILRDVVVRGGNRHGILLDDCEDVRLINCDISGFGRRGTQDLSKDGKYYLPDGRTYINNDAGIFIRDSGRLLVERCWIHDPRVKANPWRYSHPAGPHAVFPCRVRGEIVLRYNDFIGGDDLRWNDAVEGWSNQSPRGALFRDSDVYGNLFAFANDDGIELDGGQMNVRVFDNRFEHSLMAVSTDPCVLGPSYVFSNLAFNLGDEDGVAISAVKNSGPGRHNSEGRAHYFHNTFLAPGSPMRYVNGVSRNNLYVSERTAPPLGGLASTGVYYHDFNFDLLAGTSAEAVRASLAPYQIEKDAVLDAPIFFAPEQGDFRLQRESPGARAGEWVPNFSPVTGGARPDMGAFQGDSEDFLPRRPVRLYPDAPLVRLEGALGKEPPARSVSIVCRSVENTGGSFRILRSDDCAWLKVAPRQGALKAGQALRLSVSMETSEVRKAGTYKGIFLVKLASGHSTPISVVAVARNPGVASMAECEALLPDAELIEDDAASGRRAVVFEKDKTGPLLFSFSVPRDGRYFLLVRIKRERRAEGRDLGPATFFWQLDDGERRLEQFRPAREYGWDRVRGFDDILLAAGAHRVQLFPTGRLLLDKVRVASEPHTADLE